MESVLGRVVVMIVVGVIGGAVAILLVRAESEQREAAASAGTEGDESSRELDQQILRNNLSFNRGNDISEEMTVVPEVADDIKHWREQLQKSSQTAKRIMMTSQIDSGVDADGDFLDSLLLAIRRRLLSYSQEEEEEEPEEEKEEEEKEEVSREKRGAEEKTQKRGAEEKTREKRFDGGEMRKADVKDEGEWKEIKTNQGGGVHKESGEEAMDLNWQRASSDHHIRHPRRKSHHRHHKTIPPGTYHTRTNGPGIIERPEDFENNVFASPAQHNGTMGENPPNKSSIIAPNRINSQFDNLTNVIIMGNITHIRTPHDIIEDDSNIAAEIREALLLAVPLSLLLTVILLICVAFCCCRYRTHPAYSDHMSYALREDEYIEEWPTVSTGVCDVCLPDISYQAHLATKIKKAKKRRAGDQIELVLEGDTMETEVREEGLKCHPPLYTLLSNLPPGSSSHLEDDDDGRDSPFGSFGSSRPRRSQSLEFLTV